MASSRRIGANNNESTYDSAGGKDYSVMQTWESATDLDLVAAAQSESLECYKGAHDDDVIMTGIVGNSVYFRVIRPAAGEGHSAVPEVDGSMVAFVKTSFVAGIITIREDYSQIQDVVLDMNVNNASPSACVLMDNATGDNSAAVGVLVKRSVNSGAGSSHGFRTQTNTYFIINCLANDCDNDALLIATSSTAYIYDFTEFDCARSIRIVSGCTANTKNCILDDTISVSGTHNQTTNTTGTPTYVDSANDNFLLAPTDTVAIDNGTDLSADGSYAFDDDILKNLRTGSWDIGFNQFIAGGGGSLINGGIATDGLINGRLVG